MVTTSYENPLNFYGPMFPPTFEAKSNTGGGGASEEEVRQMIDSSLENAVFIGSEIPDNSSEG